VEVLAKISDFLGIPADYFLNDTPYPTNAVKADPTARTPVQFWGKVSAGVGAYAEGVPLRAMAADDEDMQEGYEYAWLEVEGDSMYPDLQDGDYILVRVQDTAQSGDMVVALVDDGYETDGLVKRIEIDEGSHLTLISTNPAYPPRVFIGDRMNDVRIFGVVVSSKRKWR
jgi:repressor LexA